MGTGVWHGVELFLIVALIAILRPAEVHFLVMLLDELGYPGYLTVAENTTVAHYGVTVALDKELGGTAFGKLAVTGMDMHALDHAEGREIEVITHHLEIVILRHGSVLQIFQVLLQVVAGDGELDVVHRGLQHLAFEAEYYGLVKAVQVEHTDAVAIAGEGISVHNEVGLVGNGLDIRHKQRARF